MRDAWIELQTQTLSAPTAKRRLEATRHLFDWLAIDQIVRPNPAASDEVQVTPRAKRQDTNARATANLDFSATIVVPL
jgi:hypothetical protein